MVNVKCWSKKIICFLLISLILTSGICGDYYQAANIEVQAAELVGVWTFEEVLSGLISFAIAVGVIEKTGVSDEDIIDFMDDYLEHSPVGISATRLRELSDTLYNNNKGIFRKEGYTSADEFYQYLIDSNVDTLGAYLKCVKGCGDAQLGFTFGMPWEVLKEFYRGIGECLQTLSEKNIEIGEDGTVSIVQSSSDVNYSGFLPHAAKCYSVSYHHSMYAFDSSEDVTLTSYTNNISSMFEVKCSSDSTVGWFVALSNSPGQSITRTTSSVDMHDGKNYFYENIFELNKLNANYDIYALVLDIPYGVHNSYISNYKYVPGGYSVYDIPMENLPALQQYLTTHPELFSLEDTKTIIVTPKTDDELRDLDGTVITPGMDVPAIDDPVNPAIDDPVAPAIDDPAIPDVLNPTFIGAWFGKLVAWLQSIWDMIKSGNNWLSRIYDGISNAYTVQGAMLRLLRTLDFEAVKEFWTNDIPDILDDIKVGVLDIPNVLSGIGEAVLDLPNTLDKGWQGLKDVMQDILDHLDKVWVDGINDIPDILAEIKEGILDIPNVLDGIKEGVLDIPNVLDLIKEGVLDIPNVLSDILDWLKALEIPIPLDYTSLLERIIAILDSFVDFFVLDQTLIIEAARAVLDIASDKFNVFRVLTVFFNRFQFDGSYSYPCVKMGIPDVLVSILGNEIILIDFGKYKTILLSIRTGLKAVFWFLFAHHLLKMFTPKFRIS